LKNVLWNPAQAWAMQNAADKNLPIILFFVEKDDEETRKLISGQKVAEYSTDKAMFVIVPKVAAAKADAKAGPTVTGGGKSSKPDADAAVAVSPVPVNKLLSEDLWKAYSISKVNTMVVTDWYGNSHSVYASVPKEGVLTKAIDDVPTNFRAAETKVDKELAKLEGHLAKGSDIPALRSALKIFKMEVWGFASVNTSIEKYREIVVRGRERLKAVEAEGNVVALRKLKTDYKGSELDVEVDQAVARLTAAAKKE